MQCRRSRCPICVGRNCELDERASTPSRGSSLHPSELQPAPHDLIWGCSHGVSCFKCFIDRLGFPPISYRPNRHLRRHEPSLKHLKHETPTFRHRRNLRAKDEPLHGAAHTGLKTISVGSAHRKFSHQKTQHVVVIELPSRSATLLHFCQSDPTKGG